MKELVKIQQELKAPKNQYNSFGKYKYRSCEDILEAVKPLLSNCTLTLSDEVKEVGGVPYVEATATLSGDGTSCSVSAQAGISINRKGMDVAQSFGASSSYARKYALAGLFLLDDTKDPDTQDNRDSNKDVKKISAAQAKKEMKEAHENGQLKTYFFGLPEDLQEELREHANELRQSLKG